VATLKFAERLSKINGKPTNAHIESSVVVDELQKRIEQLKTKVERLSSAAAGTSAKVAFDRCVVQL